MTDFAFEPCGPDCVCADFAGAENDLTNLPDDAAGEATFDLSDRVFDNVMDLTEEVLREAYTRGYSDGMREGLDTANLGAVLGDTLADLGLEGETQDEESILLDMVNEDLASLEQSLDSWAPGVDATLAELNRWAPGVDEDLEVIGENLDFLSAVVRSGFLVIADALEKLDIRLTAVEDNQVADAAYLDALGQTVEKLGRELGEGVYLR